MRLPAVWSVLTTRMLLAAVVAESQGGAGSQKGPALLQDYIAFTVTQPPAALELDPFYKKYGRGPASLLDADPRLYELVSQVIPATKMPGNVYVGRLRQAPAPR